MTVEAETATEKKTEEMENNGVKNQTTDNESIAAASASKFDQNEENSMDYVEAAPAKKAKLELEQDTTMTTADLDEVGSAVASQNQKIPLRDITTKETIEKEEMAKVTNF